MLQKEDVYPMHQYFLSREERRERGCEKKQTSEANVDGNFAIWRNYVSFETWLRHRNRALNASPSQDVLEISSLTPGLLHTG